MYSIEYLIETAGVKRRHSVSVLQGIRCSAVCRANAVRPDGSLGPSAVEARCWPRALRRREEAASRRLCFRSPGGRPRQASLVEEEEDAFDLKAHRAGTGGDEVRRDELVQLKTDVTVASASALPHSGRSVENPASRASRLAHAPSE
jgi:hypothetical protein